MFINIIIPRTISVYPDLRIMGKVAALLGSANLGNLQAITILGCSLRAFAYDTVQALYYLLTGLEDDVPVAAFAFGFAGKAIVGR